MSKKKSQEEFVNELRRVQPTIEVLGSYADARTPLKVRCDICGNEWNASPTNLLRGRHCPKCSLKSKRNPRTMEMSRKVQSLNPQN